MRLVWNMRVFVAAALPALLSTLPAQAEEGGLPQLDTSFFPSELFWLAVTFAVLYGLMAFVALPRVTQTKLNRRQVIRTALDKARTASDEAALAVEKVEKVMKAARDAAHSTARDMMVEVGERSASLQATQEKELLLRLQGAETAIAVAKETALASVRASASDLSAVIEAKVLGTKPRGVA